MPVLEEPDEGVIGIPVPVANELVFDDPSILSRDELRKRYGTPTRIVGRGIPGEQGDPWGEPVPEPAGFHFTPYEVAPIPIKRVMPEYPELARQTRLEGKVVLAVRIDRFGNVVDAEVAGESGTRFGFEAAALIAIVQWKFRPAVKNGHPVEVWYLLPIQFEMNR